jgi:hypothetical protein
MKLKFLFASAVTAIIATSQTASAKSWVKWVDCKDGHGNQLVIDIDVENNSNLQMVLRPAPNGKPSVIKYLEANGMVYSQPEYKEVIVNVSRGHLVDFENSDEFLTHLVKLDNPWPKKMAPYSGALLKVIKNGRTIDWYFNECEKYY